MYESETKSAERTDRSNSPLKETPVTKEFREREQTATYRRNTNGETASILSRWRAVYRSGKLLESRRWMPRCPGALGRKDASCEPSARVFLSNVVFMLPYCGPQINPELSRRSSPR